MTLQISGVFQLMNFVETVHHGFFEEPEVFKRVPTRHKKDNKTIPRYQNVSHSQTVAGDAELARAHKMEPKALQMEEMGFVEMAANLEEESVLISEKDKSNEDKKVNSAKSDSLNDFLQGDSGENTATHGMYILLPSKFYLLVLFVLRLKCWPNIIICQILNFCLLI